MRYLGTCPHCGTPLEFTSLPPPLFACGSCSGRCMLVLPEGDASAAEVQLVVLPAKERGVLDGSLERNGWRGPVLVAVIAGCALAVGFLALGISYLVAPGSTVTETATGLFAVTLVLVVSVLTATLLALPVTWFLFGRRGRSAPEFALGRSAIAIAAGLMTFFVVDFAQHGVNTLLHNQGAPLFLQWSTSILGDVGAAVLGGLLTVRLAPTAPYRHTVGVAIILVLSVLLFLLGLDGLGPSPLGALVYLVFVPPLLLGAWLGVRLGWLRPRTSPPATG